MNRLLFTELVQAALREDLPHGDLTSEVIFNDHHSVQAVFRVKESGVIAGLAVAAEVFQQLDPSVQWEIIIPDGNKVKPQTVIAKVSGGVKTILAGERVALNFLQHLSGIATQTARLVELVTPYPAKVIDTRKTTPGLRLLEKYAVRQGGGMNHRFSLSDAVLIKDNHIAACGGSITEAIKRVRQKIPHTVKIEVETENKEQVLEALAAQADIIMLDNMSISLMSEMVALIDHRALVEASGMINEQTIHNVAATGVDLISCGALTHSVKALDISLDFL